MNYPPVLSEEQVATLNRFRALSGLLSTPGWTVLKDFIEDLVGEALKDMRVAPINNDGASARLLDRWRDREYVFNRICAEVEMSDEKRQRWLEEQFTNLERIQLESMEGIHA